MSHSALLVFLAVLGGIYTIQGENWCEDYWGGRCFGTQVTLFGGVTPAEQTFFKCDSIIYDVNNGCPYIGDHEACCVNCSNQTNACKDKFPYTVARNNMDYPCPFDESYCNPCCPNEFNEGQVYPDSRCFCCQLCKPKRKCKPSRNNNAQCFNCYDPVYNKEWCLGQPGGKVYKHWCEHEECYCCIWHK